MNSDLQILSQLVAMLRAGLTLRQAESTSKPERLSESAAASYRYLRQLVVASGGPPVGAMERVRVVLSNRQEQLRKIELAYASPRATVRLVLWLPLAALLIGQLGGLGSIAVLFRSPIALASVLLGGALLAAGNYWSARMLRTARVEEFDQAILLDGISLALLGGLSIEKSRNIAVAEFRRSFDIKFLDDVTRAIDEATVFSKTTGASLSVLLQEKADQMRAAMNFDKSIGLEKLSVRLLIPLGASVLPAFALIAVAPIAISFLTNQER